MWYHVHMWLDLCEGSYTCNYNYLEIQFWNIKFNISWEWTKLLACLLHKSISYSRQFTVSTVHWIANWIACHFRYFLTGVANTTSTSIGWEGAGQTGSHKVAGKGYVLTKNSQMTSNGVIFISICHTKQLNPWPNSSVSHVVNHSWLSACQGKMGLFKGHPSTHGHQTG